VDCWSLGAVLYVMLVARFPEFDRSNGGMRVKMESASWATVSDAAKDLIQRLMQPDPQIRYSVTDVSAAAAAGGCVCGGDVALWGGGGSCAMCWARVDD
jgi:serine/threonine protein kinase